MLLNWFKRWEARRQAELDARAPWVRERVFEVVRELAAPLVEAGQARLEWTAPDPEAEGEEDGTVGLVPTNDAAASAVVIPSPSLVTLCVGPRGNSHELVVDKGGQWRRELRACLEAIVEGRYQESASPGWVSRQVVTMTFEMPDANDIVVEHHDFDPGEAELATERRFASYV